VSAFIQAREHGTRATYVAGCRCDDCRAANTRRYGERQSRLRELAVEVQPSGPAIAGTMRRGGRDVRVRRCPGANGDPCVRGGAWLRGSHQVCGVCVERATVWAGLVPPHRARAHLLALRDAGVGYKAVAAACDVAASALGRILAEDGAIRATTERRILAVDASAIADGAIVDAATMNAQIAEMRRRGFTLRHIAELLGRSSLLQLGTRTHAIARTVARVDRLFRKIERGEIEPRRAFVDATVEREWLLSLIDRGVTARWLSERLGFTVQRSQMPARVLPKHRSAIRVLRKELEELQREGTGLPDDWASPGATGVTRAFGYEGGWLVRSGSKRSTP
jgi:hypothetical protein